MGRIMLAMLLTAGTLAAQPVDPKLYGEMRWRTIGPLRGGRTVAAVGVPGQPSVFYIGAVNGGVWKTNDYGRVWTPIFDDQPTGSIGSIAVAPSEPNILYVGCGEGLQRPDLAVGDGIYKSADAGKTWQHLGLRDGQQIPAIIVDPHDPNRLFVAVLGHPYGPNAERGIFRSLDGGKTFEKVLYRDENTGGMDLAFDPSNSSTVYAVLWAARQGPWENAAFKGKTGGLFKSTDGGTTWSQLTNGLPAAADGLGRIGIDVAPSNPKRLYANVDATKLGGIYRSDDAGETWQRINSDSRLWERGGDFNEVRIDPKDADVAYVANVVTWKTTNGGRTFESLRGAPGGDDYHRFWINPDNPKIILLASDQGAIVTVNGGETWSSWYNQPTAQMFHVSTDNAFPYRVCGGQQESGSACVASRGSDGEITFREWHPVAAEEYGYAVPDPLDPELIYGGKLTRYDRRTGQVQTITPHPLRGGGYRVVRTQPVVFSPVDPHVLYFASNTLWKTTTGGQSWTEISPDLTRKEWSVPSTVGVYGSTPEAKPKQRGVIYAIAPSPLAADRIWAGTDDGLIQLTTDGGKSWKDVTPAALQPWWKVSIMEASHFDAQTAYAAINTLRVDDLRPHIFRTRDGGTSWTEITNGIPDGGIVNVVREDPRRRGLLFAGTEQTVYVSFDDGDHWQSLRLNLPATSIRDLVIHDDDLVIGTHGRGFWILDDIEPLRQVDARSADAAAGLFRPQQAWRWRWNTNPDTPLPPDEPAGQNPPDGAIIDYWLKSAASGPVTLEIADGSGNVIRRFSSSDLAPAVKDEGQIPWYWIRPPRVLSGAAGMHRFVWDLHYPPSPAPKPQFSIAAVAHETPASPRSPWVMTGDYVVKLTVDGKSWSQPLTVKMDPRVTTSREALQQQFELSKQLYDALIDVRGAIQRLGELRTQTKSAAAKGNVPRAASERNHALAQLDGEEDDDAPPSAEKHDNLPSVAASLTTLLQVVQEADVAPASQVVAAVNDRLQAYEDVMKRYRALAK
jgi:photosystem II stability/assembly factor-like uncharacterized protein